MFVREHIVFLGRLRHAEGSGGSRCLGGNQRLGHLLASDRFGGDRRLAGNQLFGDRFGGDHGFCDGCLVDGNLFDMFGIVGGALHAVQ